MIKQKLNLKKKILNELNIMANSMVLINGTRLELGCISNYGN